MDAALSRRPEFVADLWRAHGTAEVLIASCYVSRGTAAMPKGECPSFDDPG